MRPISEQIANLPDIGKKPSSEDSDFELFILERKRIWMNSPGGFFDENPFSGQKPLIGKIVLD